MRKQYGVVALILFTFFVISFLTNILGALNPSVSISYGLTETMAGFLPFSFFIAYGIMSIPAGFLLEKYGEKSLLLGGFLLAFLGSLVFTLFPTFLIFLVSLFVIGTGMAVLQVVINPLLRVAGGEENFAFTSVLGQLIFGMASFISPLVYTYLVLHVGQKEKSSWFLEVLTTLVPQDMSWVSMYVIFALLSLCLIILVGAMALPPITLSKEEQAGTKNSYRLLFRRKTVILYFLGIFAYVGAEQGISYWMSKFLLVYHGLNFETVGAGAVANFWGLMTVGGILGLVLLRILDSRLVLRIFSGLAMICLSAGLFGDSALSLYGFQSSGFFLSVMFPIIVSLALNSVSEYHGSMAGILMTGIMGGAVVQLLIGFISDLVSLKFGMLLVFMALGYIFSIGFWAKPLISNKTIRFKKNSA
ncbi:MFS transporter [Sediminicola sp. 1XM1-17]|uniref:MFS transporter n=1 Tax=Sediminicola sp. 1XM1-17 TaxID=3127702 RepID=UPI003076C020